MLVLGMESRSHRTQTRLIFLFLLLDLKRSGKSCRLRWVNYLHPGLKRGKMTPHEERLVLQLQSKWGNRWSRIARKLPGRTDNEIKNYWRTHMRKKAQESKKKRATAHSSTSSSSSSSSIANSPGMEFPPVYEAKGPSFYDTGGVDLILAENMTAVPEVHESSTKVYSMDEIWKDIELSEESNSVADVMKSPLWDFGPNLWSMDEEESKMLMQMHHFNMGHDHFHSFPYYNHMIG